MFAAHGNVRLDPVPAAGRYTLTNPDLKPLVLSFNRLDADTIQVTVRGARKDFVFNVSRAGEVATPSEG